MNALAHLSDIVIPILIFFIVGYGFVSKVKVYETFLKIWTDEVIHAFLKVVRIEQSEDGRYICGTIFIGLPEMNARRIEVYDLLNHIEEGEAE